MTDLMRDVVTDKFSTMAAATGVASSVYSGAAMLEHHDLTRYGATGKASTMLAAATGVASAVRSGAAMLKHDDLTRYGVIDKFSTMACAARRGNPRAVRGSAAARDSA